MTARPHPLRVATGPRRAMPQGMTRALLCSLVVALAACDQPFLAKPATGVEESRTDVSGDRRSLSVCLDSCKDGALSDTDRATCRLNCDTAFKVTKTEVVDDGFTKATRCMQGCRADKDAKACRATCRAAGAAEAASAGPAYERLEQCVEACHGDDTLSADNRATCELTCAQEARRLAGS